MPRSSSSLYKQMLQSVTGAILDQASQLLVVASRMPVLTLERAHGLLKSGYWMCPTSKTPSVVHVGTRAVGVPSPGKQAAILRKRPGCPDLRELSCIDFHSGLLQRTWFAMQARKTQHKHVRHSLLPRSNMMLYGLGVLNWIAQVLMHLACLCV